MLRYKAAPIAQWIKSWTSDLEVGSSIPTAGRVTRKSITKQVSAGSPSLKSHRASSLQSTPSCLAFEGVIRHQKNTIYTILIP